MAAPVGSVAFADDAQLLAFASPDGTLKIYETSTGRLKQEFTPSSHLSSTCTCLAWSSVHRRSLEESPRKKKKRKSSPGQGKTEELQLIAMGTTSGTVLLYSVVKGDIQSQMEGGHTDRVNDACWKSEDDSVITCSSDQHIVEWSILTGRIKNKWKGDKGSVNSLCTCPGRYLFSAGRSIKLWDLDKLEVLKNFTGHENEVCQLLYTNLRQGVDSLAGADSEVDLTGGYLISCARNERILNVWQANPELKSKNSLASFSLPDSASAISMVQPSGPKQPLLLAAVTEAGQLLVFEHILNGPTKKPLQPKVTVQVASQGSRRDEHPRPLPVLAAAVLAPRLGDSDELPSLLLAYGSVVRLAFEKLPYQREEPDVCLVRADPMAALTLQDVISVSKVKVPSVPADVTMSGPDNGAPRKPTQLSDKDSKKKRKSVVPGEMSMSERLNALSIEKPSSKTAASLQPPKMDTLATLLSQGLHSNDKKILNNVLQNSDEKLILNTIRRLPVACVVPLVKELAERMHGHAQSGRTLVRWLKTLLTVHTSYLVTFPDLVHSLGTLYSMMDARTDMLAKFMKLQGKLDLMLSQINAHAAAEDDASNGISGQPVLFHRDSSSDEDMGDLDEMLVNLSESEGDWDETLDNNDGALNGSDSEGE